LDRIGAHHSRPIIVGHARHRLAYSIPSAGQVLRNTDEWSAREPVASEAGATWCYICDSLRVEHLKVGLLRTCFARPPSRRSPLVQGRPSRSPAEFRPNTDRIAAELGPRLTRRSLARLPEQLYAVVGPRLIRASDSSLPAPVERKPGTNSRLFAEVSGERGAILSVEYRSRPADILPSRR
jgi:hypothetical protein